MIGLFDSTYDCVDASCENATLLIILYPQLWLRFGLLCGFSSAIALENFGLHEINALRFGGKLEQVSDIA